MSTPPSAARRPSVRDAIVEEHPDSPLPPRRVALQALASVMPVENRQTRLLPLAFAGLCLPIAWFLVPDEVPFGRSVLAIATLIFAAAMACMLRQSSPPPARGRSWAQPARAVLPREFERFIEDGIVASRRRGRTAALLRFGFVLPNAMGSDQRCVIETIGENTRDVTRAYDFVHVASDGAMFVFIAHLPCNMSADSIARRILDDLHVLGSPSAAATQVELTMATLAEGEEMREFIKRHSVEPVLRLRQ